jgi:hypothetical protein
MLTCITTVLLLISNIRRVLNVVCFLLGDSPVSSINVNVLEHSVFHLHGQVGMNKPTRLCQGTECSKTLAFILDTGESPIRKQTTKIYFTGFRVLQAV